MNASTHLRKINEHRMKIIEALAPDASDYGFGGAHRMWVKQSACLTADAYITKVEEIAKAFADSTHFNNFAVVVPYKMAVPMPPSWKGERPAEIAETYGHPHTKGKDWRHFENTLRWQFANKGYMCDTQSMNNDEGIVFVAKKMIDCLHSGMPKITDEMISDKNYNETAITPDYDEFIVWCDKHYEGSVIAEQKATLEQYPPALRPMIAMSMA